MGPVKCLLLAAVCMQVSAMPLSSQLSEEEEKVTRCIMEVLAESLSSPGPERVSSSCIRILKEDERLISMLRHQHLLRELEDLTHREKSQLHAERGSIEEEELKKRTNETPKRNAESKRESENEESKEYEKIEKVQVKEKEHGTSDEEKVHELLEEEEEKRNAPVKKGEEDKRNGKEARSDPAAKRKDKKHFSEESDEDSSEEQEQDRGHHGANNEWYHRNHEGWEEEKKRASQIRMAEDPSQEETAQFESEDRGMKFFNAKTHMQGYHGEDKRHVHHPEENEMERERTYYGEGGDEMGRERHHYNGRPGNHENREEEEEEERELEEMEEREEHRAKERDIHEVEEELRKAAERLQELHRG